MRYWIRYERHGDKYLLGDYGTRAEAYMSFMMEGDHAFDYGKAEKGEVLKNWNEYNKC
jgi:hypothetical protein